MKRPQMFLEEHVGGDYVSTTIRIFYPDGTSEYFNMNRYYDNGNVLLMHAGDWEASCGDDWTPDVYDGNYGNGTTATFLGYL